MTHSLTTTQPNNDTQFNNTQPNMMTYSLTTTQPNNDTQFNNTQPNNDIQFNDNTAQQWHTV